MIPAPFEYHAPKTLEEALRLVERHGDEAKVLAGGHSLLPLMKLRLASPRFIVDIGRLRGMSYIREEDGRIAIGALTTHADIEHSVLVQKRCALLAETAGQIGDVQVRNRGTLGGSLAHADPAADYPASILALDAEIVVASSSGTRTIAAREFFVDMLTTQPASAFLLLGQRFVIDSYITGDVVYDKIIFNGQKVLRMLPSTLDVLFALGNDASAQLLEPELARYNYSSNLAALRYLVNSYEPQFWNSSLFNGWLSMIRTLNPPQDRTSLPTFMQTAAWWQEKIEHAACFVGTASA